MNTWSLQGKHRAKPALLSWIQLLRKQRPGGTRSRCASRWSTVARFSLATGLVWLLPVMGKAASACSVPEQGCAAHCYQYTKDNGLPGCHARCVSGGVHFSAPEITTCEFTMTIPCVKSVSCFQADSDCDPFCITSVFGQYTTWAIPGDAHGLKITGITRDSAIIEPAGSLANVKPGLIQVTVTGSSGGSKYGTLAITVDDGSCGCGAAASPLGGAFTANKSVSTLFEMGKYAFGKTSGSFGMKEVLPSKLLSTPTCLSWLYDTNTDCEVLTNSAGLRQLKSCEGLADIFTNSAYKYSLNVFPRSGIGAKVGGYYQTNGIPLHTITIENPDTSGATSNLLRVTDGFGYVSDFTWKTNGWELSKGAGLRREYRTVNWNAAGTMSTNQVEVRDSGNQLISSVTRKYQAFPFGTNVVEQNLGTGSAALTTTYDYYTNGLGSTGKLAKVIYEDGRWELHYYNTNGLRTNTCMSWLNQPPTNVLTLCRSIEIGRAHV